QITYSLDKIESIATKISIENETLPVDASYKITNNQFIITNEKAGRKVDKEALIRDIKDEINKKTSGQIDAVFVEVTPKHKKEDFEKSTTLLGSFSTIVNLNKKEKLENLKVADRRINNQTILPEVVLSVCEVLGPRTLENGYVEAGQITFGMPDRGVGGGICQASSTLYMAALYAELDVIERVNHSLMVSYMQPAFDATIAQGSIDLKIKNNSPYPVLVQSILENYKYTINIYGHESRPQGRKVSFEPILIETIPATFSVVSDPSLPAGHTQTLSPAIDGSKYELYKIITHPDKSIERIKINTSKYRPVEGKMIEGVEEVEENYQSSYCPDSFYFVVCEL
ncbi:MAG: VanW family protein, partial [Defluviitaleaceae bacterium]|nr:VanW family protein [Defluviitaleaceae bacterium]